MTSELATIDVEEALGYELRIEASPDVVWSYWVDPDRIVRWMGAVARLDPRPGGIFRVDYGQGDVALGEYIELDPPNRLVLAWGWEGSDPPLDPGSSRVEVDLEAIDGGTSTLLRLRHLGLAAASRPTHDEGWRNFLPKLPEAVAAAREQAQK